MEFGYKSDRWKKLRAAILRRDGYQCQKCRQFGRVREAVTVHHIRHADEYPELAFSPENLISLCQACHNAEHPEKGGAQGHRGAKKEAHCTTLVIGLPGTGKSTYVRQRLGDGVAYDLDALAAAFRLRAPHEESHPGARRMANDLAGGFFRNAGKYAERVFVIRTAPPPEELKAIAPQKMVVMRTERAPGCQLMQETARADALQRIEAAVQWAQTHGVPVVFG